MTITNKTSLRTLKKGELYYSDLVSFLPINKPDLSKLELEVKGRTYKQKIHYMDQPVMIGKLRVITINPKKEIDSIQFTLRKRKAVLEHQISFSNSKNLIEFELRIISVGDFFIRLYTKPVDKVNLDSPAYFKLNQISKNGDNI